MSLLGQRLFELDGGAAAQVCGAGELQRERGVDDVTRRQPVVHPGTFWLSDTFLHNVDERGDVVLGDQLSLVDRGNVEAGAGTHRFGGGGRHDSDLGPRFGGQDLDLEPRTELRLVGEQRGHLGQRDRKSTRLNSSHSS